MYQAGERGRCELPSGLGQKPRNRRSTQRHTHALSTAAPALNTATHALTIATHGTASTGTHANARAALGALGPGRLNATGLGRRKGAPSASESSDSTSSPLASATCRWRKASVFSSSLSLLSRRLRSSRCQTLCQCGSRDPKRSANVVAAHWASSERLTRACTSHRDC